MKARQQSRIRSRHQAASAARLQRRKPRRLRLTSLGTRSLGIRSLGLRRSPGKTGSARARIGGTRCCRTRSMAVRTAASSLEGAGTARSQASVERRRPTSERRKRLSKRSRHPHLCEGQRRCERPRRQRQRHRELLRMSVQVSSLYMGDFLYNLN